MNLFEQLRSPQHLLDANSTAASTPPRFVIIPSEKGATLRVLDKKGNPWIHGYQHFHGPIREVLKAIDSIQSREASGFVWDGEGGDISLTDNDHLMRLLEQSDRLFNAGMQPISIEDKPGKITVAIDQGEDHRYNAQVCISSDGKCYQYYTLLTESRLLVDKTRLLKVQPMGAGFIHLPLFKTTLGENELTRYLTLLYSMIDEVSLDFAGYSVVEGEMRKMENCVIFEECDEAGNLKLRMSLALSGFDPEFLENYEISRIATINEMERRVVVSPVLRQPLKDCIKRIERGLKSVMRSHKGDYYQDDNFFLIGTELVSPFLDSVLPDLLTRYRCFGADNLKRFKLRTSKPALKLERIKSGIDFLDTNVEIQIDDQRISLASALDQFKKNRYVALNDGSRAIINEEYIKRLNRLFRRKRKGSSERVSFFDLPFMEDLIEEKDHQRISGMKEFSRIKEALSSTKKARLPKINATLRPYQKSGYQWLQRLNSARLGGCLADDMGLGKTLQAITLIKATNKKASPPSLVVMPRSLIFNWQKEIEKFAPDITFAVHHGQGRNLTKALKAQVILTTYGTLRSDIEEFQDISFHYLILDESQNIKNPSAQATKAVLMLNSEQRLALSGTPIENNLTELYSLFKFLNPSMFDNLQAFNQCYALPIVKDNDIQAMRELQRKIAPFILRRTKKEVLKDLPDKVEQILYVDMSDEQAALYENRRLYYKEQISKDVNDKGIANSQFAILQAFTELRQIASTPSSKTEGEIIATKRELAVSEIAEATANGHKCLLFANFIGALEGLSGDLDSAEIDHVMMTGATRDRQRLVETFQNDERVRVFLMTLKTGGVGLNLTAADYVFIYDPWWNLAAETQAIDRTHRIGQKNTVFTYKLVTRNTIEEKILQLQQQKGELFNSLIGADSATLKSFTEADIQFALGVES